MVARKKATKKKPAKKNLLDTVVEVLANNAPAYQSDPAKRIALAEKIVEAL